VLVIDYGYPGIELYDPDRRPEGTLRAYLRIACTTTRTPTSGRQDLTAHVDVTAVEQAMIDVGLEHLGTTTQSAFLVGLGVEDRPARRPVGPGDDDRGLLELRSSLVRMLDPAAMGPVPGDRRGSRLAAVRLGQGPAQRHDWRGCQRAPPERRRPRRPTAPDPTERHRTAPH
jgi:hypothetical protein